MVLRYLLLISFFSYSLLTSGQEDTLYLDEVEVPGTLMKYADGIMVDHLDTIAKKYFEGNSLGNTLQQHSGIYIRRYGAEGQLSSVSFRGTTPSHTIVTWNGVDINSQTLGQSDFSSIPTFLFSDISFYHGANSTLNGSGAVGGTIDLGSGAIHSEGSKFYATQHVGSYGKYFSGIRANYGNDKIKLYLGGYYNTIENDFKVSFRNTTYPQNNAASELIGTLASIKYHIKPASSLTAEVWYNKHDREVQPVIGNLNGDDLLLDENIRSNIKFENAQRLGFLEAGLSFVKDKQKYNNSSATNLSRYRADLSYEYTNINWWTIKVGGHTTFSDPEVSNYLSDQNQWRGAAFLLNKFQPLKALMISFNIRQPWMQTISAQWVPSMGLNWKAIKNERTSHSFFTSGSRSFRFPTLNDLFWNPGGNPNLKPEDGVSAEIGYKFEHVGEVFHIESKWSLYQSWLSEMIVWVPQGILWQPENVRKVGIKGIEHAMTILFTFPSGAWKTTFNYALNQSQYQSNLGDTDQSKGNQLAYVPIHKGAILSTLQYKSWVLTFNQNFTGKRYTESFNSSVLDPFSIGSIGLEKRWTISKHQLALGFNVNNLWNADYMNYELRATPGRNYLIKIDYQLNK